MAIDPLLTDLYQLTMLQAYWRSGMNDTAVFEFFVRKLPAKRSFLIAAGLEQALDYLEGLHFRAGDIAWLRASRRFDPGFLDWLQGFRFTGAVDAAPEGTVFFSDEPILRISAPLPEAQFVESRLVNLLHFQTMIASKAARMVLQRPDALLIDFGMRRAHGAEAGLLAARAAYIAGFSGSATLAAERDFGVPAFGTMAHSFVQAHAGERDAFRSFAETWPENVTLLIDTYDTEAAAREVVDLVPALKQQSIHVQAVRLDSGDMIDLSKRVRAIFDAAGLAEVRIFVSSSIDEYFMAEAKQQGAPIDGFGVGTHLTTSADVPYLDCAYKLQEYAGVPRRKRSPGKSTWPGRKQVFRQVDDNGHLAGDLLALVDEHQAGQPLLCPLMRDGRRIASAETMTDLRKRCAASLASLPELLRRLDRGEAPLPYKPAISDRLRALAAEADRIIDAAAGS